MTDELNKLAKLEALKIAQLLSRDCTSIELVALTKGILTQAYVLGLERAAEKICQYPYDPRAAIVTNLDEIAHSIRDEAQRVKGAVKE